MSFVAAAVIGSVGAIGAAGISAYGASKAAGQQAALGREALGQQNALFQQGMDVNRPFIEAGQSASKTLLQLLTPGESQTATLQQLPGFQFASDWGQRAVANQATTTGLGGNALTEAAKFATGLAGTQFGNYVGQLQALTDTGRTAAGNVLSGSVQQGQVVGNTLGNIGNAQAAGTLGVANAAAGGLQGAAGSTVNALLLNKLLGGGAGAAAGGPRGIYTGDPTLPGFG